MICFILTCPFILIYIVYYILKDKGEINLNDFFLALTAAILWPLVIIGCIIVYMIERGDDIILFRSKKDDA